MDRLHVVMAVEQNAFAAAPVRLRNTDGMTRRRAHLRGKPDGGKVVRDMLRGGAAILRVRRISRHGSDAQQRKQPLDARVGVLVEVAPSSGEWAHHDAP